MEERKKRGRHGNTYHVNDVRWTRCGCRGVGARIQVLAAIEQFKDQATNRLLIAALEEYEDSGTTQKEDVKKTPAKVLPSTKHCMCTICIFVVNDYNKQI